MSFNYYHHLQHRNGHPIDDNDDGLNIMALHCQTHNDGLAKVEGLGTH